MDPWASNAWNDEVPASLTLQNSPNELPSWNLKPVSLQDEDNGWGASSPALDFSIPSPAVEQQQEETEDDTAHEIYARQTSPSLESPARDLSGFPVPMPAEDEAEKEEDTAWSDMKLPAFSAIPQSGLADEPWERKSMSEESIEDVEVVQESEDEQQETESNGDDPWASQATKSRSSALYSNGMVSLLLLHYDHANVLV